MLIRRLQPFLERSSAPLARISLPAWGAFFWTQSTSIYRYLDINLLQAAVPRYKARQDQPTVDNLAVTFTNGPGIIGRAHYEPQVIASMI